MYTIHTQLEPDEARMYVQSYFTKNQWQLAHRDGNALTFTRTIKPKPLAAIVLLCLWVIPGILYLVLSWKKQSCNVFMKKEKDGAKVTVDGSGGSTGLGKSLLRFLAAHDQSLATVPDAIPSFWEGDKPLYAFIGVAILGLLITIVLVKL